MSRSRLANSLFWLPLGLSAAAAVWLAWLTYRVSAAPLPQPDPNLPESLPPPLWTPDLAYAGDHSPVWAWVLVALMVSTVGTYAVTHRGRMRWIVLGVAVSMVVLLLGLAAYLPCVGASESILSLPAWVLSLFVGAYEFDGPAKGCAMRFAPGFSLARSLGVMFTVTTGATVILGLLQERIARFRVRLSDDLDVVIGLNQASLPLVYALAQQNKSPEKDTAQVDRRPGFLQAVDTGGTCPDGWWRWWLTGMRPGDRWRARRTRRLTVVLDGNAANPLLGEARGAGAVVLIGTPSDRAVLRNVAVADRGLRRRVAFHRMFAVSNDMGLNLQVNDTLRGLLGEGVLDRADHSLPRLFVRMDDERRAQKWRTSQIQALGANSSDSEEPRLIRDAVTVDGLASIQVVEELIPPDQFEPSAAWPTHVALVGDSSLSLACLDELAWQLWARAEIGERVNPHDSSSGRTSPVLEVALFGHTAAARKREWDQLHGRWERNPIALHLFDVEPMGAGTDEAVMRYLDTHPRARAVFVEQTAQNDEMASRLARLYGGIHGQASRIVTVRPDLVRVPPELGAYEPVRIATGLVFRTEVGARPPTDSMTRFAQQQHRAYRSSWSEAHFDVPPNAAKQTGVPWTQLPQFFKEDNVRQYWQVLSWYNQNGYAWTWSRDDVELPDGTLDQVAVAEYERWAKTRTDVGWWPAASPEERNDSLRMHPDLRGWDHVDPTFNKELAELILRRTMATGLVLVPKKAPGIAKVDAPASTQERSGAG